MQNHSTPQYYRQSESTLSLRAVSEEMIDGSGSGYLKYILKRRKAVFDSVSKAAVEL